jgi:uncharacterized protein (DUF2147 family)
MKIIYLIIASIIIGFNAFSQSDIRGKWKTIDDETGEEQSIVEIYEKAGKLFGKITKIFPAEGEELDPICDLCPDDRKNEKIIGMEIIRDMQWNAEVGEYEDGKILDPQDGKTYDCVIWKEGDELKVRGYVAFFYRTQTWKKVN